MSARTDSRQRKIQYGLAITALMIPIIVLGAPGSGRKGGESAIDRGGVLAQMRTDQRLGESTLGKVDPSSSTMTFVLLGFRGLAANQLWLQADEQKSTKQWEALRQTVDSIILLQPYFKQVWQFQGWNLAYNVSAEWDAVADRYHWVKEGGKFLMRGTRRIERYPELYWETGRILGPKIGRSDEWRVFRRYFRNDPFQLDGGPDLEIAQDGTDTEPFEDNYLAAKHWWTKARDANTRFPQRMMAEALFRGYPARAQFDYAGALHREGTFNATSRLAWDRAYSDWTVEFGANERFATVRGGIITLEGGEDELRQIAEEQKENGGSITDAWIDQKIKAVDQLQKMVNYNYWKKKASIERQPLTETAHRQLHLGRELYHGGQVSTSVYYVADRDVCAGDDPIEGVTDEQRALLSAMCSTDFVWIVNPDDPSLPDEKRAELDAVRTALYEDVTIQIVDDLAKDLGRPVDDVIDDLADLTVGGHLLAKSESQVVLERGMEKYAKVLENYTSIVDEDVLALEEALMGVLYFRKLHEHHDKPLPADFPLKVYWDRENGKPEKGAIATVIRQFERYGRE